MQRTRQILWGFLFITGGLPQTIFSDPLTLIHPSGERIEIEIESTDRFLDVLDRLQACFQENGQEQAREVEPSATGVNLTNSQLHLVVSHAGMTARAKQKKWRDYHVPVSKEEKKDLAYIINTLSTDSIISIGASTFSLKDAGKRIDHLHPFRFLMTIFMDEKLKAGAHAIQDRGGLPWSGFLDGITGSLEEESKKGNVLPFVSDFAAKVKIDEELIIPDLEEGRWKDFVNILIDKIPRKINPNRYDM